jgi:hypothetical protein
MSTRRLHHAVVIALTLVLAACGSEPASVPTALALPDEGVSANAATVAAVPTFVVADPAAPAIANPVISFWAKRGRESEVFMYYQALPGETDSSEFLRFRVRKRSLQNYPNGQPIAAGDSILITITLTDPVNLVVNFQPSGLVFRAGEPAKLKMSYLEADDDYNQDGIVNNADLRAERKLKLWRLHPPNPWTPQLSVLNRTLDEVETYVPNFTSYAIAF